MAIQWGAWEYSGGNGMRVGIEVLTSAVTTSSPSVTFTFKVYTQNQYSYSDSQTLNYGGSCGSGSDGFTNSSGSSAVLRATETCTYNYTTYGSSPGTRTFSATISGAYNGVTPTKSVTVTIPARPYAAPLAPSGVSASRTSDTTATVTWTNNTTAQKPYTSKTLQMRTYTGSTWSAWTTIATPSAASTSQAVTGLSANRKYQFQIRSNNSIGSSSYVASGEVKMTPAAPSAVTAARSGANIAVNWTNAAYTDAGITWTIERSVAGGAYAALASGIAQGTLTYTDASPGVGTNQYRVKAVQATGSLSSAWTTSNVVSTVVAPLAPSGLIPNGLAADFLNDLNAVIWTHNPGGDGAAQTAYQVQFSNNGGATWTALDTGTVTAGAPGNTGFHNIAPGTLANGVTYQWRVRTQGVASAGWGPYSAAATVIGSARPTATIDAPTAMTSVLPLSLAWSYNQDESSPQAAWEAELVDGDGAVVETTSGTTESTAVFAWPVVEGETYTLRLRVQSAAGLWSAWESVDTEVDLLPPAPSDLDAEYDVCSGSVLLTVTPEDPTPGVNVSVDHVYVERKIGDGPWMMIAENLPVPISFIDTIPSTTKPNEYRVTSVSDLPSYYVNPVVVVQNTEGHPGDPLWSFLSYGDGFTKTLRLRGSLATSATSSRARAAQHFMGRGLPTLLVGEAIDRVVTVAGTSYYDDRCAWRGECDYDSPRDDWESAAWEAEVVCYRDHTGRRLFGMLGDVATDDVFPGVASVGFSVTQTGYMELPGIAPTAGENLADPDWLTSNTYWGSLAFGYQFPVGSFVPEAGGMRLNWNLSPSQAGNGYQLGAINGPVNLDPILEVGKRYRFTFRCVLASGSTQVRASIGFVGSGSWVTVTDVPVDVSVDYTWTAGKWVGLESGPNPVGSVLVQSISIKERLT